MVLSHHGKLEFGSPKLPMIPEAVLLHYLDDLDAKMHMMRSEFARHEAEGGEAGEMTDWVRAMEQAVLEHGNFPQAPVRGVVMNYLLKTEPTAYSFADLVREKETDWTGVTNPQAVKDAQGDEEGR